MEHHLKKHFLITSILALLCASVSLLVLSKSSAGNLSTNTTLGILPGSLTFIKDATTNMDTYFSHSPDSSSSMNIGQYGSSLGSIIAASTGNHRFTISDMLGSSFVVTIQSTALNSTGGNSISANNIRYTGTNRLGTGKTLTAAPIYSTDIGTAPVTFVSRENNSGLSLFSQEIILKVNIPPAQKPGTYTGSVTFTY